MFELTKIVAEIFDLDYLQLFEKGRKRNLVEARQVIFYIAYKKINGLSLAQIGAKFNKDHATVLYGIKMVQNLCDTNKEFKEKVDQALVKFSMIERNKICYIAHPI